MTRALHHQNGGIIGGMLKLLVMVTLAYLVTRTDAHLDKKYEGPPPATVVQPAPQPPTKVK
jgi:hypothetical protein